MFNSALTFLLIFSVAALVFYLVLAYAFPYLHRKRVGSAEMPESWERVLSEQLEGFNELGSEDQEKIRKLVKVYMAEKFMEPRNLKWDQQILICALMAKAVYNSKGAYLNKLSTIKIGKSQKVGQGFLQVSSIQDLKEIDYKKWS